MNEPRIYKDKFRKYFKQFTCCTKNKDKGINHHIQNDLIISPQCDNTHNDTIENTTTNINTEIDISNNIQQEHNDNDMDNNDEPECSAPTFVKYNSFQIDDVDTTFQAYCTILEPIVKLKPGDKLSIYNDKIYVSSNSWTQSMERWYYSQSRQYSMEHIKQLFYEYNYYINRLLVYYKDNESSFDLRVIRRYQLILKDILNINITLITSLIELTQTYKNDNVVNGIYNTIYNDLILRNTDIISKLY